MACMEPFYVFKSAEKENSNEDSSLRRIFVVGHKVSFAQCAVPFKFPFGAEYTASERRPGFWERKSVPNSVRILLLKRMHCIFARPSPATRRLAARKTFEQAKP